MQETLGIVFIAMAAVLMVMVGVYGLAPLVLPRRTRDARDAVRRAAASQEDLLKAVSQPALDKGRVEELFAEIYSVREAVAALAARTRDAEAGAPAAVTPAPDLDATEGSALDQGAVEELFAELFSIRTAVASLSGELRALREALQTAETTRRRPARHAA